jgi:multidrug resistance efflux pump
LFWCAGSSGNREVAEPSSISQILLLPSIGIVGIDGYLHRTYRNPYQLEDRMKINRKYLFTGAVVVLAVLLVFIKYFQYITNPWTRDGQVQAEVIQITPRVSGPIVKLPIQDNQFIRAGELLFEIDPRTFQASFDQARAQLDQTGDSVRALEQQVEVARAGVTVSQANIDQARSEIKQYVATIDKDKAEYKRQKDLLPKKATSQRSLDRARANYDVSLQQKISAEAGLIQARAELTESQASLAEAQAQLGALGDSNPQFRAALAAVRLAELNLEFTKVRAPVDGYVTNLNLWLGNNAVANQPALAFVDTASYWVNAFFKENVIADMQSGDRAVVTLMTYQDEPLEGFVESLGWGIAQQDGSTSIDLLPKVNPTFEWIRLAQRVPVRIQLKDVPDTVKLRVGTTASVLVLTGTSNNDDNKPLPPVPAALQ